MNEMLTSARAEVVRLAMELSEFETVRVMHGLGETTATQLRAENDDIQNYPRRSSPVGFACVDPKIDQSGKKNSKSKPSTMCGLPHLRKTLFYIMTIYLQQSPTDEAVYQFLDKKRTEGSTKST